MLYCLNRLTLLDASALKKKLRDAKAKSGDQRIKGSKGQELKVIRSGVQIRRS